MNAKQRKVFNSRPLFYGFLALMLAIATSKYIFDGKLTYILLITFLLISFVCYCIWAKNWKILIGILSIFIFGLGWFFVGENSFKGNVYTGDCQIVGRISDDVSYSQYGTSARVVLKDVYINDKKESDISLTIYIDSKDDFNIGDIIVFESEISDVQLFTLGSFNSFLYRDGTRYESSVSAKDFIVQGNSLNLDEKFRLKMKSVLYDGMGEENGAVAYAVLFGDKSEVDEDIYASYKTAGVIHLLTVSGLHVSFLITLLGFVLKKCKVKGWVNFVVCAVFLGFYAYICGLAPSIMRAGIMGLVLLATKLSGKCYDNLNTLGLSGIIILLCSPLSALDVGFLMSFFCVLGIFMITPGLSNVFAKFLPRRIADALAVSFGAQIGILPFMANIYSQLNFLTLFVNLIVIPLFSILYPLLFVSVFVVSLMPFMSFLLKVSGFGLTLIYKIAEFFGSTKLIVDLEPINIIVVALGFVMLFLLSRYFMANKKIKIICCSTIFVLCCVFVGCENIPLSVKSGISYGFNYSNSMVILTNKNGQSVVVDIGYTDYTKKMLYETGIKEINTAFVLNDSTLNIATAREVGVENIVRCGSGEGYAEETTFAFDEAGISSGFTFVYKSYQNRLIGLEILFDDTKIFIFRNINQNESAINSIIDQNYDIVILDKKDEYASCFSEQTFLLSYYQNEYTDKSFEKNGNIYCRINGKNFKWRGLD